MRINLTPTETAPSPRRVRINLTPTDNAPFLGYLGDPYTPRKDRHKALSLQPSPVRLETFIRVDRWPVRGEHWAERMVLLLLVYDKASELSRGN